MCVCVRVFVCVLVDYGCCLPSDVRVEKERKERKERKKKRKRKRKRKNKAKRPLLLARAIRWPPSL